MPGVFDNKVFNAEVFQQYVDRIPNLRRNELIRSRAIRPRPDLATAMAEGTGGNYITTPLRGLISGSVPLNYDGQTDITADSTVSFSHSRVVVGRAKAWTERDFSYDITGGEDFIENIAQQQAEYWEEVDQDTIIPMTIRVYFRSSFMTEFPLLQVQEHDAQLCLVHRDGVVLHQAVYGAVVCQLVKVYLAEV